MRKVFVATPLYWSQATSIFIQIPGQENIDPGVGGDDDDEGQEKDLAVVQRVVDVRPVVRAGKWLQTIIK